MGRVQGREGKGKERGVGRGIIQNKGRKKWLEKRRGAGEGVREGEEKINEGWKERRRKS